MSERTMCRWSSMTKTSPGRVFWENAADSKISAASTLKNCPKTSFIAMNAAAMAPDVLKKVSSVHSESVCCVFRKFHDPLLDVLLTQCLRRRHELIARSHSCRKGRRGGAEAMRAYDRSQPSPRDAWMVRVSALMLPSHGALLFLRFAILDTPPG